MQVSAPQLPEYMLRYESKLALEEVPLQSEAVIVPEVGSVMEYQTPLLPVVTHEELTMSLVAVVVLPVTVCPQVTGIAFTQSSLTGGGGQAVVVTDNE